METSKPKIGKFSLNYGLILGGLGVVFGFMLFMSDAHTSQSPVNSIIGIVMMIGVIFWGILNFRKANGDLLKTGEAVKLGAGIALVAGILSVIWTLILTNVLDPDFASKTMDARLAEAAAEGNFTPEQLQQQKEMGMEYFWVGYPVILIFNILIGLIIGLVGGLIFKKAAPDY
ncbi:DUF4199 domain-containing protein [Robiginitalea aurantiaca]|uniref:DUF4199 domain-containing protein n=1 Tax=Robiginitalea aurantiaca TaxID=3056915 RepID=A0ABT7WCF4_9FLAO|nr:DUF4199 domain-containing protein [Robiginitalea aurantiaca]MDM9630581.1 DUF4199 domain-containing protein [Robiginitalea aurantiaca]